MDIIKVLVAAFKFLSDTATDIVNILADIWGHKWGKLWDDVKKLFSDFVGDFFNLLGTFARGFWNLITGLVVTIAATLKGLADGIIGTFQWLYNELIGHSIIPDMINGIVGWFGNAGPSLDSTTRSEIIDALQKAGAK